MSYPLAVLPCRTNQFVRLTHFTVLLLLTVPLLSCAPAQSPPARFPSGYSQDWTNVVQEITTTPSCSRKLEIGKRAGLKIIPEGVIDFRNYSIVTFLDPITHKVVNQFSCEEIPMHPKPLVPAGKP